MATVSVPSPITETETCPEAVPTYRGPFAIMTTLFFVWGFMTVRNDILIPRFKEVFTLSYFQAMLMQLAFVSAHTIVPLKHRNTALGIIAIFMYVCSEVAVDRAVVNFLGDPKLGELSATAASIHSGCLWFLLPTWCFTAISPDAWHQPSDSRTQNGPIFNFVP